MSFTQVSPHGVAALMSVLPGQPGVGDFEGGTVKAMLLGEDSLLFSNFDDVVNLASASSSLDEYVTGGGTVYHRRELSTIIIQVVAGVVQFRANDLVWNAMTSYDGGGDSGYVLFYVELSAATGLDSNGALDERIPLALMDLEFTPNGEDVTVKPSSSGFWAIDTNGC